MYKGLTYLQLQSLHLHWYISLLLVAIDGWVNCHILHVAWLGNIEFHKSFCFCFSFFLVCPLNVGQFMLVMHAVWCSSWCGLTFNLNFLKAFWDHFMDPFFWHCYCTTPTSITNRSAHPTILTLLFLYDIMLINCFIAAACHQTMFASSTLSSMGSSSISITSFRSADCLALVQIQSTKHCLIFSVSLIWCGIILNSTLKWSVIIGSEWF